MPELPEVETVKRDLTRHVLGLRIETLQIVDARVIRDISAAQFKSRLTGRTIKAISRRGKAIVWTLDNGLHVVIQLMMTGQLVHRSDRPDRFPKETKVIFQLSNGIHLIYNDQRLFGRLTCVEDLGTFKHFMNLGPEPFEAKFNPAFIKESFRRRMVPVKNALMDHTFVAGIGNIYASEILFRSGIDPRRKTQRINAAEIERMHRMTLEVLEEAILHRGSSMRNYRDGNGEKGKFNERIKVYAREGEPCLTCGQEIIKIVQGGRSTFFCKQCQR